MGAAVHMVELVLLLWLAGSAAHAAPLQPSESGATAAGMHPQILTWILDRMRLP